jgi:hypothetical protein
MIDHGKWPLGNSPWGQIAKKLVFDKVLPVKIIGIGTGHPETLPDAKWSKIYFILRS